MTSSWYSISISLQSSGGIIFTGYFSVDNTTNLVTATYETINGTTNFSNNLLIPTGTGTFRVINADGFSSYDITNFLGPVNQVYYDNGYMKGWKQFDTSGLIINKMSYYPSYKNFNFYATNGDQSTSNIGTIIANNNSGEPNNIFQTDVLININPISNPISNICFPAKTCITTDQGDIHIEKINPEFHSIDNKKIVAITQTISQDNYLICFEKNSLSLNYPKQKTIMSKEHKIYYKGQMIKAYHFLRQFENVKKIKYNGEILYNVLMEDYDKINVNNFICETLHPENIIAKLYTNYLDEDCKNKFIIKIFKFPKKNK